MAAENMFYIPVRDADGDMMPNISVGAYLDLACTQQATLVNSGGASITNPFTTDADGDQFIYVEDANIEMLYFRVVGQTIVVPIRCANTPLWSDYAERTTDPGDSALILISIAGTKYRMTWDNLARLLVDKIIAATNLPGTRKGFVVSDNRDNATHAIVFTVDNVAPQSSDGVRGDVWAQVS
jgi:hypothetical protein